MRDDQSRRPERQMPPAPARPGRFVVWLAALLVLVQTFAAGVHALSHRFGGGHRACHGVHAVHDRCCDHDTARGASAAPATGDESDGECLLCLRLDLSHHYAPVVPAMPRTVSIACGTTAFEPGLAAQSRRLAPPCARGPPA